MMLQSTREISITAISSPTTVQDSRTVNKMIAKHLLPLAVLLAAASAKDIAYLCKELSQKFELLQKLEPLLVEFDLGSEPTQFISGPAKFKLGSPPGAITDDCKAAKNGTVVVKLSNTNSFILTPTRVLTLENNDYTFTFDVQKSDSGDKKVIVTDFHITSSTVAENGEYLIPSKTKKVLGYIRSGLLEVVKDVMDVSFHHKKRFHISRSLVQKLMFEVYQSVAQDF